MPQYEVEVFTDNAVYQITARESNIGRVNGFLREKMNKSEFKLLSADGKTTHTVKLDDVRTVTIKELK